MTLHEYGNPGAEILLIQPVGGRDRAETAREAETIRALTGADFRLVAVEVADWNRDLSPWAAAPVFGDAAFGAGAAETLKAILPLCRGRRCYLGGYSLAGLFALWAGCRTEAFAGIAAASPSVWFPGFVDDLRGHAMRSGAVYLSLGEREPRTRSPVMATVGDCIRASYDILRAQGVDCTLEWNPGGHFNDPSLRTAHAFAWVLSRETNA